MTLQTDVKDLILGSLDSRFVESKQPDLPGLVDRTARELADGVAKRFLTIDAAVRRVVPEGAVRVRRVERTSTLPVGFDYYSEGIVKGRRNYKVGAVLLPTKSRAGVIEFYFRGVGHLPDAFEQSSIETLFGLPVWWAFARPSDELQPMVVQAVEEGLGHITRIHPRRG